MQAILTKSACSESNRRDVSGHVQIVGPVEKIYDRPTSSRASVKRKQPFIDETLGQACCSLEKGRQCADSALCEVRVTALGQSTMAAHYCRSPDSVSSRHAVHCRAGHQRLRNDSGPPQRLHGGIQLRSAPEDAQWPHALRIHL